MGRAAPMGAALGSSLVMSSARGVNVLDVDGNRYVDLAAGFGALLLGHGHPAVLSALERQSRTLLQALGDVYPSEVKVALLERLAALYPEPAQVILAQSGSDAVSAALKTAQLHTGKPGVLAFTGAYHGLGYGPLASCGLRSSYREPFAAQLNPHVRFVDYPNDENALGPVLDQVQKALSTSTFGAILVEPILGRGGVIIPPEAFLPELARAAREAGVLLVADEIWTGLGRAGLPLVSLKAALPDLICLGKGLGGGLPMSALVGRAEVMASWRQTNEVVHTATFAGAPLAAATALATLEVLDAEGLAARSARLGERLRARLQAEVASLYRGVSVRSSGLMIGIDLGARPGAGSALQAKLLERGYITSTGGGKREVLVLTPPLVIHESRLDEFVAHTLGAFCEIELAIA
jgi:4-aminobutyrate aminotransferase / (S)-3-amino-2-methylpropionate transaminase / 5-aminovalerate transaminase